MVLIIITSKRFFVGFWFVFFLIFTQLPGWDGNTCAIKEKIKHYCKWSIKYLQSYIVLPLWFWRPRQVYDFYLLLTLRARVPLINILRGLFWCLGHMPLCLSPLRHGSDTSRTYITKRRIEFVSRRARYTTIYYSLREIQAAYNTRRTRGKRALSVCSCTQFMRTYK